MTAKEYFKQIQNEYQHESADWRLVHITQQMFNEIGTIRDKRQVKTNEGMLSIFKEINLKFKAFARLANEIEPFKSEGKIKEDGFKIFVHRLMPEINF